MKFINEQGSVNILDLINVFMICDIYAARHDMRLTHMTMSSFSFNAEEKFIYVSLEKMIYSDNTAWLNIGTDDPNFFDGIKNIAGLLEYDPNH